MNGISKDSKRTDVKAYADELEKANFALTKKVAELEATVDERDVDVRAMTKKLRNQEEQDTHYKSVLENFTKQAKEQYKKYENYLDNAEDLLNYVLQNYECVVEMAHGAMDSVLLGNKVELGAYFDYENKAAVDTNVKAVIDRFSRSQFLAKKKLFVDIKKRLSLKSSARIQELQDKCEKMMEESTKVKQPKSIIFAIDDNMKDEAFENTYYKLIEHIDKFREMLNDSLYPTFSAAALNELLTCVNGLSEDLLKYLNKFKTSMGGSDTPVETFNADIDSIKRTLDNLEKLEYGKLIELREKNNKLQIIQNHIKNLSKENEDLVAKITSNEFNLLVNNEIILAYEKSIREKEQALNRKLKELEEAKTNGDQLNQRIAKITLELIGRLSRRGE